MNELKNKILSIVSYKNWKKHFSDYELKTLQENIEHFDNMKTFSELKHCIVNEIYKQPKCWICDKEVFYINSKRSYNKFCCTECQNTDKAKDIMKQLAKEACLKLYNVDNYGKTKECREKMSKTMLAKYGVEHALQSKDILLKKEETNLKKYGTKTPAENVDIKEKTKQTMMKKYGYVTNLISPEYIVKNTNIMIKKYGVNNYTKTEEYKIKSKKTMLEKYGVDNYAKTEEYKIKVKSTNLAKYGVEYYTETEEFKEKTKRTNMAKYGLNNYVETEDFKEKTKQTCLTRYGTVHSSHSLNFKLKMRHTNRNKYWDTFVKILEFKNIKPLFAKEEYLTYDYNGTSKKYHCYKCNKDFESKILHTTQIYCSNCSYKSSYEYYIKQWLEDNLKIKNIDSNQKFGVKNNPNRTTWELDLYLPDYNIGIEFHGIYWHSDIFKNRFYHREKYLFFKEKGIELIQIFENEWLQKEHLVKSIIKNKLKKSSNIIPARKTIIKTLSNNEYKSFCELNHIQGYSSASVMLGLFYQEELVSCISLSSPRYNKNYEYEIIRSCNKIDTVVIGGFDKLFKYFKEKHNPESIITYSDVRYFNGNSYLKSEFEQKYLSYPNYFYFKRNENILYHRSRFQKHKLENILTIFDNNKSEYENMLDNNYLRIFDAGNLVFEWNKK